MFSKKKTDKYREAVDRPILGRTLPSLLDEAERNYPNKRAFNQWHKNAWHSQSTKELRTAAEELALGMLQEQSIQGEKIALLMHSDRNFCLADFASLLAGLVNVPIDLTQTLDNIVFILRHSATKVLIVSDLDLLAQVIPYLGKARELQTVIVTDIPDDWELKRNQLLTCGIDEFGVGNSELKENHNYELKTTNYELKKACLCIPMLLCQTTPEISCPELPQCIELFSLDEVRAKGKKLWSESKAKELRSRIAPQDLATIVYIAGDTGQPKGVMLSHENITADILTTFASIPELKPGKVETVLSFLPLTHIFARAFIYGHLNYGHSIYFSTPNRAARDFKTVKPTLVATVPRMLEKIYQKMLDGGSKLKGIKKSAFDWALKLVRDYELGKPKSLSYNLQLKLANWLVFARVRQAFGGRLKYFISGGAGLKAEIANALSAAGMTVLQGYGLTETSSVICCNQAEFNRAGTVGLPIPGAKIAIAPDREILVKAPYVMQGYYQNPKATKAAIDEEGWLHTGDLGEFTPEGFLTITGSKKDLFKLSTGKYVTPQPLEDFVRRSPLVAQAIVVGRQKKFCGMLIFPELDKLRQHARSLNLSLPITELLQHPAIVALYQSLVDEANRQLPRWSQVKQFKLVNAELTVANGLLQQNTNINRAKVNEQFATQIDTLYGEESTSSSGAVVRASEPTPIIPQVKNYLPRLNLFFWFIEAKQSWYPKLQTVLTKIKSISTKRSLKKLIRKTAIQAKLSWKRIENYITLPSTMPWRLQENNDSEDLDSIEGRKT